MAAKGIFYCNYIRTLLAKIRRGRCSMVFARFRFLLAVYAAFRVCYRPQRQGKVMFLHVSVILFTRGRSGRQIPPPPAVRHPLPGTATAADGTHPTGMHSCCKSESTLASRYVHGESNLMITCSSDKDRFRSV